MKIICTEQGTPEWDAARAGLPTASEFSKIITSTGEPSKSASAYARTLAAEKYAGASIDRWDGNQWTQRGKELEDAAIAYYEFTHDAKIERTGFITDDEDTMGCSPDGLVGSDGMIELKCLKAETHIETILYHRKNGRCPPQYVQQTQGQILIGGRDWCDLLFFHPVLPPLVIRQQPNPEIQGALKELIPALIKERDEILSALQEQGGKGERQAA